MASDAQTFEIADKDVETIDVVDAVPAFFIDGMQGSMHGNGVVRIGMFQLTQKQGAPQDQSSVKKLIVGRLIMTPDALISIANWLGQQAKDIQDGRMGKKPD